MTIEYTTPVRHNTPQAIKYTFKDQDSNAIDLSPFASVRLDVKHQGETVIDLAATMVAPLTSGQVQYASYTFARTGVWNAQFYLLDGSGNKTYGEPIQFTVTSNLDDLGLSELPSQ